MKEIIVSGKNIIKAFDDTNVLNGIDIEIYKSDFTVVMGTSGAGKSTLMYSLGCMETINSGEIFLDGQNITALSESELTKIRRTQVGFVFQSIHLVSNLTLFENALVAGFLDKSTSENETIARAESLFKRLNIENIKDKLPCNVSGGEAQRAAIARAVINKPDILFADEPTGALNKANTEEVLSILKELNSGGQSILMVTHDIHSASYGDRVLYMDDGRITDEIELKYIPDMTVREEKLMDWLSRLKW